VQADLNGALDGRPAAEEDVTLVHLALATHVADILRAGVRAAPVGPDGEVGVWCQPAMAAYALPEARRRELRQGGHRAVMAVHVDLPAGQPVLLAGAGGDPAEVPAAEAAARIAAAPDQAWQVLVPRSVTRREIRRVHHVSCVVDGPRLPSRRDAGQRPLPRPGRRRSDPTQRPLTKPQLLASLVGSIEPGEADEPPPRPAASRRVDETER